MDARMPCKSHARMDTRRSVPIFCSKRLGGSDPYGLIVSGSSADPIVGHFAVTYHDEAEALGIDLNDLYSALLADGNNTPPNCDIEGRQADAYM